MDEVLETEEQTEKTFSITLTEKEVIDVVTLLELGVKSLNWEAFVPGGILINKIREQVNAS